MIMYIPVDEETDGGTPIANNIGLKIAAPPMPRAPAAHPPVNAKINSLNRLREVILISLSAKP